MTTEQPISNLFPPRIRDALIEAARTPITSSDPLARDKAINAVIERARSLYPEKFINRREP
jgi:hypothetical protein